MLTINKNQAIEKINSLIQTGRTQSANVVQHVLENQPVDYITPTNKLTFDATAQQGLIVNTPNAKQFTVHRHALSQISEVASIPTKFIDTLTASDWGRALIAHNLNEVFAHVKTSQRNLVRTVNGQVLGFLSDSYRRIDSRGLVEAFVTGVRKLGAEPYKGYVTDTKIALQAIMPDVYEPIPGEILAAVASLENSDFGNGAVSFKFSLLRIWCDNLHMFEETLRQIHLGRRLDDNLVYSQRTYELDSKTTVSALTDVINAQMNREGIQKRMAEVEVAAKTEVDPSKAQKLLKEAVGVTKAQEVIDAYKSADIEMIPAGNTQWRLANAISWVAGKEDDAEKKLELQKLAGKVLQRAA